MNKDNPEELVKKLEEDPAAFTEVFLERKLSSKQKEFLNSTQKHKHILSLWSRQTGKSTIIASYILHRLLYGKGQEINEEHMPEHIAIVAPIKDQIKNLFDKISSLINKSDFISAFITKMNTEIIKARNGNEAKFLSASPGSQIRGYTATCIVIDESQDITDNKYNGDVLPFGATTDALVIEAGTPKTKNHFYQSTISKNIHIIRQPWFECPFLSEDYVMRQKETSPEALWRQEYLCEFMEEGVLAFPSSLFEPEEKDGKLTGRWNLDSYSYITKMEEITKFKRDTIAKMIDKGATYRIGIDLGKSNDNTVVTIIRDDIRPIQLEAQITFTLDTIYTKIAKAVALLYNAYQPTELNLDYSNEKSFVDILRDVGVPIIADGKNIRGAIAFTNRNKAEMVSTAKILLENYKLQLPKEADALLNQFLNQQFEMSESGQYKFYHPSNEHDDALWSTLLALKNIQLSSSNDIATFQNPWEKMDNEIHGEKESTIKDAISTSKDYRMKDRYVAAELRRKHKFRS